jgi:hypothetical protein
MKTLLCFAECEPVQGLSSAWAVIGLLEATAGMLGIRRSLRHRARP